jgi:PhnB protein
MKAEPYLNFEGRCDEAIEFYKKALGAKVEMLTRFKDAPAGSCPGGESFPKEIENKVMHSALRIGDSTIMASDGRCTGKTNFHGIALSLTVATEDKAEQIFNALQEGGKVTMPLEKTFFSPKFGMLSDRFGVGWMILVQH